jgi:hypothetical protein
VSAQEFYAEKGQRTAIHESGHTVIARYLQVPEVFEKVSAEVVPVHSVPGIGDVHRADSNASSQDQVRACWSM